MLADHNGRDDMYRLAAALSFEIDDLLPVVDAAVMLGFAKLEEGDVEITPAGRAFAEADILRRKELFRTAALETSRSSARSPGRSKPAPTTRCRTAFSKTCSTNTSARRKPRRSSKRPSDGAATRSCSITTPTPPVLPAGRGARGAAARGGFALTLRPVLSRTVIGERTWSVLLDLVVFAAVLAGIHGLLVMTRYWFGAMTPAAEISRSPARLPLYAFYSVVRIAIAYVLSLLFALVYGYIAAYNKRWKA
jgi:hypothetical protein